MRAGVYLEVRAGVYLEVRAGDAGCDLFEERLLHSDELRWLDYIQDLLDLSQEHHLKTHAHTQVHDG